MSTLPSEQALEAARDIYRHERAKVTTIAEFIDYHTLSPEERRLREAVLEAGLDGGMLTSDAIEELEAYLKAKPTLWAENRRLKAAIGSMDDIIDRKQSMIDRLEMDLAAARMP